MATPIDRGLECSTLHLVLCVVRCVNVALCGCLIVLLPARAKAEWWYFREWDGLGSDFVEALAEDDSGNLWFGTRRGLTRYDGVSWRTFTEADGLSSDSVYSVAVDRVGTVWVGTNQGVSCYDGHDWVTYDLDDGLVNNMVHDVVDDSQGRMWFATSLGVSCYDGQVWTTYTTEDGLVSNSVRAITEDSSANLWFATSQGVTSYDGETWTTYTTADGLADNSAKVVAQDHVGHIWVGTYHGLSRFDGSCWTTYSTEDGLSHDGVRDLAVDQLGRLWVATREGISRFDGRVWRSYTPGDGSSANWMTALLEDESGNVWFGTCGGGVARYDHVSWTTFTTADGLASDVVTELLEDSSGLLWFGTDAGLSTYDGSNWDSYGTSDGLPCDEVNAIAEDLCGNLWVGTDHGVGKFDGTAWTTYTTDDGLVRDYVVDICCDQRGDLWFGTTRGASCYDGLNWVSYTEDDVLPYDWIRDIEEDSDGNLWFACLEDCCGGDGRVCRFDGSDWVTYGVEDGLAYRIVNTICCDEAGRVWFGTARNGVSCFDGTSWTTYHCDDGLADEIVHSITEDSRGFLWFGTDTGLTCWNGVNWLRFTAGDGPPHTAVGCIIESQSDEIWLATVAGVSEYYPDYVPPQTVVWPRPPGTIATSTLQVGFEAAFEEDHGVRFSWSLDDSPWSDWNSDGHWLGSQLADGNHVLRIRSDDLMLNVDQSPAVVAFEVDATPPAPVISRPVFGEAVCDSTKIRGSAADDRFERYELEVRATGVEPWLIVAQSPLPIGDGILGTWNTRTVPDGSYEIRLSVTDTLDLTGTALVRVVVDNEFPWASETSPALVSASSGGDVFTTNEEVHLYFPPHAFADAATVTIEPSDGVPDTLASGAELIIAGYDISWEGSDLGKPATLEMALGGSRGPGDVLALYVLAEGEDWRRLGGTVSGDGAAISAPIEDEGTYAIYSDSGAGTGGKLTALTFTPRVFSPSGSFADDEVAIGFTLGRSGPVTVKVYNRAGRLVREVASGLEMVAGANLVRWDGRDGGGAAVPDGLYVITVEADGERVTETLAVVR